MNIKEIKSLITFLIYTLLIKKIIIQINVINVFTNIINEMNKSLIYAKKSYWRFLLFC